MEFAGVLIDDVGMRVGACSPGSALLRRALQLTSGAVEILRGRFFRRKGEALPVARADNVSLQIRAVDLGTMLLQQGHGLLVRMSVAVAVAAGDHGIIRVHRIQKRLGGAVAAPVMRHF